MKAIKKAPSAALLTRARDDKNRELAAEEIRKVKHLVGLMLARQASAVKLNSLLEAELAAERMLREQTLPTMFDELGLTEIKLDDGTLVKVGTTYHPAVLKDDEPEFFSWLKKNKFDSIIKNQVMVEFGKGGDKVALALLHELRKKYVGVVQKRYVHPQTFKAFIREQMEKGASLPSVVNPNPVRTTTLKTK